eukprot:CAMPEP_0174713556 /NCGR_PEP_ID=MMETSP1094-20130205/14184_1 /TAXON_ID=156173 /ORGANISM="Chrysochromulina brevifilum, Strain UTEX LB 985" /LENGTH=163 /DNA_ID=CAMNT_0015912741 /DNA_START=8 /DNA_END=499 /DNA_ORIENTATION=+
MLGPPKGSLSASQSTWKPNGVEASRESARSLWATMRAVAASEQASSPKVSLSEVASQAAQSMSRCAEGAVMEPSPVMTAQTTTAAQTARCEAKGNGQEDGTRDEGGFTVSGTISLGASDEANVCCSTHLAACPTTRIDAGTQTNSSYGPPERAAPRLSNPGAR